VLDKTATDNRFPSFCPSSPHPVTRETIPIGMGHEFSGTVAELGPGVDASKYKIGQKAAIQPTIYCGSCGACQNGVENGTVGVYVVVARMC